MRSTLPVLLTTFATARRLTSTSMRPASSASNAATISEPSGSRAMVVWSRPGCFELGLPPKLAYRVWSSASGNSTAWDSASMALSAKISRRSSGRLRTRPGCPTARAFPGTSPGSSAEWQLGRWPGPSDSCPCRPSQKHSAHGPEFIKIHYPWHALHGQNLRFRRKAKLPRGEYIFCDLPDGTIGGFPAWMSDASSCSGCTVGAPLVSVAALAELHVLLSGLHSDSQRGNASMKEMRRESTNDTKEDAGNKADEPAASAVL